MRAGIPAGDLKHVFKYTDMSISHSQQAFRNIFRTQSTLYIFYGLSQCEFTCGHHRTVAAEELSPTPGLLTRKEVKQKMESLKNQLEQVTREAKEQ